MIVEDILQVFAIMAILSVTAIAAIILARHLSIRSRVIAEYQKTQANLAHYTAQQLKANDRVRFGFPEDMEVNIIESEYWRDKISSEKEKAKLLQDLL